MTAEDEIARIEFNERWRRCVNKINDEISEQFRKLREEAEKECEELRALK
jgi:hypothetical protein